MVHVKLLLSLFITCLLCKTNCSAEGSPSTADVNSENGKIAKLENAESNGNIIKNHILMFHPWGTRSHSQQLNVLLRGLLKSGNAVTGVFAWKTGIEHPSYVELVVRDG